MKHNIEDCKIKLRAIWSLAQQIKLGAGELDDSAIRILAELIQQDTKLLEAEDDGN
jgi:hypothetical protein